MKLSKYLSVFTKIAVAVLLILEFQEKVTNHNLHNSELRIYTYMFLSVYVHATKTTTKT